MCFETARFFFFTFFCEPTQPGHFVESKDLLHKMAYRVMENHVISKHMCVDHYILLLKHLSDHINLITNGFKRFLKINTT